jgi:predicted metal-dependent phosphoesterase TrpH
MNPALPPGEVFKKRERKGGVKFADLHLHTIFSDSTYTPKELIADALKAGLSCIAVVDHDCVDGITPTIREAKGKNIEVIPGIEISAEYKGAEIHFLGYFIDYKNRDFTRKLSFLKDNRIQRIYQIIDKLKKINISLNPKAVFRLSEKGTVGRLHVARAMVNEGIIKTTGEAFKKYIGEDCPAYVCGFRFSPQEAIKTIEDVGGTAVLAHPYILSEQNLIQKFLSYGLKGIEVYYPEHTKGLVKTYLKIAEKYNLLITGGSDCHGKAKRAVRIGSVKIPYDLVEKLKDGRA